jgi:hypothetical protein
MEALEMDLHRRERGGDQPAINTDGETLEAID